MGLRFNSDRFISVCDKASPDYDSNYTDVNETARELFQTEEAWLNWDLLVKVMELLSKYHRFTKFIEKDCNMQQER